MPENFGSKVSGLKSLGLGNIISQAIGGIFWFFIASLIGPENYGQVIYLISIAVLVSTISLVGGSTTITVLTAKKLEVQSAIYLIGIISSITAAIISFIIFEEYVIGVYIIGNTIFQLVINKILGDKSYKEYAKLLILQRALMVTLSIIFYYIIGFEGIVLGIGLSFMPFMYKMIKQMRFKEPSFSILRKHSGFMMNNFALDLGGVLNREMDKLLVVPLFGYIALGNYSLGLQIIGILGILPGIVYQFTLPNDASGIPNKFLKKITILSSIFLSITCIILAPIVIPAFFPDYSDTIEILQIMSIILVPSAVYLMYSSQFLGQERSKFVVISRGIQLTVFVLGVVILGNLYGINGIAVSFVLAFSIQASILVIFDKKLKN